MFSIVQLVPDRLRPAQDKLSLQHSERSGCTCGPGPLCGLVPGDNRDHAVQLITDRR